MEIRLPKGFIEDLKDVIFRHDILFLEEICRELKIPFREMKAKILGMWQESELQVSTELTTSRTQCIYWNQNKVTKHWIRCPEWQVLGKEVCQHHFKHPERSKLYKDLKKLSSLNYIKDKKTKEYYMWCPLTMKMFLLDDTPFPGEIYIYQKTGKTWYLLNNPPATKIQKIEKPPPPVKKQEIIENVGSFSES